MFMEAAAVWQEVGPAGAAVAWPLSARAQQLAHAGGAGFLYPNRLKRPQRASAGFPQRLEDTCVRVGERPCDQCEQIALLQLKIA